MVGRGSVGCSLCFDQLRQGYSFASESSIHEGPEKSKFRVPGGGGGGCTVSLCTSSGGPQIPAGGGYFTVSRIFLLTKPLIRAVFRLFAGVVVLSRQVCM